MFQIILRLRTVGPGTALAVLLFCPVVAQGQVSIKAEEARMELIRQVPISTEVNGKLVNVSPNEEGQYVKEGDLLIEVDAAKIRAEVEEFQKKAESVVEINFAITALAKADVDLEQRKEANKEYQSFSPTEMRQTELEVKKSKASLDKAQEDKVILGLTLATKQAQLAEYKVHAPFDGLVTKVHRWPGQSVRPGDPVLTITDMSVLRVVLKIGYKRRNEVFVGDPVEIRIDTPDNLRRVDPKTLTDDQPLPKDKTGDELFGRGGPTEPAASTLAQDAQEPLEVFTGTIRFLDPTLVTKDNTVYLSVHVDVQNRQDKYGRYVLQQGLPIEAIIIPQKRAAIIPQKRIE